MTADKRARERNAFVKKTHWAKADVALLAGDASFRKYYRLNPNETMLGMPPVVLMDAPKPLEDVKPFIAICKRLRLLGYAAPKILDMSINKGFLLLEDFGDHSFNTVIAQTPAREHELYSAAVDLLADLHGRGTMTLLPVEGKKTHAIDAYNEAILTEELSLLPRWTMTSLFGENAARDAAYSDVWQVPLSLLGVDSPVLVLRDYHADNLMWLPTNVNLQRVGLLDFQDALMGHPAYDLVSLLQDARRDVSPALEETMIARYIKATEMADTPIEEAAFRAAYAVLGAQRNAKIVGIFTRLYLRDGKAEYLSLIPRVWGLIDRNLWLPELKPFKKWLDDHIPRAQRKKTLSPTDLTPLSSQEGQ